MLPYFLESWSLYSLLQTAEPAERDIWWKSPEYLCPQNTAETHRITNYHKYQATF